MTQWEWGYFPAIRYGLPLAAVLLAWTAWRHRGLWRHRHRATAVLGLRTAAVLMLVVLLAAPTRRISRADIVPREGAVVLFDRSASMSIPETQGTRFRQSVDFARESLIPALRRLSLRTTAMAFADDVSEISGAELADLTADGERSDLGRALLQAATGISPAPRVIVLISDGAANAHENNSRALSALAERGIPVVAIGVGGDTTPATLSIRSVEAPASAPPRQRFRITAQLESGGDGSLPAFDLQLFRDDRLVESRLIPANPAGRVWRESFEVVQPEEGVFRYQIRCQPIEPLKLLDPAASATVRIADERELRVLFAQGALTWDYKFIRIALLGDPAIKLTGLSRTSSSSVLYQNVDNATELKDGFPKSLDQLSPFSVVVLSRLRPADLSAAQQQLLLDYCGKMGGGVLLIGGAETFDTAWRGTPLEQLLPLQLAAAPSLASTQASRSPQAPLEPFRLQLTPEALALSAFQLSDSEPSAQAWNRVPPFAGYARVEAIKAGAEVFATHPTEAIDGTPMPLIAAQRFGAGRSAMIGVRNFWRWRLAQDSDAAAFDRFWRQWLRYLADGWRQPVSIFLPDQPLVPGGEIRFEAQRPAGDKTDVAAYVAVVSGPDGKEVARERLEVPADQSTAAKFRAAHPGSYSIELRDELDQLLATRSVEVRSANLEWRSASRNMRLLDHWSRASDGVAMPIEDCADPAKLIQDVLEKAESATREVGQPVPAGVNGWTMAALLVCVALEWLLRKRWELV